MTFAASTDSQRDLARRTARDLFGFTAKGTFVMLVLMGDVPRANSFFGVEVTDADWTAAFAAFEGE